MIHHLINNSVNLEFCRATACVLQKKQPSLHISLFIKKLSELNGSEDLNLPPTLINILGNYFTGIDLTILILNLISS